MLLLLSLSPAFAANYYHVDSGTRAFGRGGAFVIGADDVSAQYYNPAALHNIKRSQFTLNVWTVVQGVDYTREGEWPDSEGVAEEKQGEPFETVHNDEDPIIEPPFGFATPLGGLAPWLKHTTLAVGAFVPSAPYHAFPTDGPQRYALNSDLIWQVFAGPSLAQEVTPWLTLGAGFQYTLLRVEENLNSTTTVAAFGIETSDPDNPRYDVNVDISAWDTFAPTWNAGVIVTPVPWLQVGGAFQPPIAYRAKGSLTSTLDEESLAAGQLESNTAKDEDITLVLTTPMTVRTGVQVLPTKKLRVEADFVWSQWSSMDKQVITDIDLKLKAKEGGLIAEDVVVTDDIVFETHFQDAWSVRLGGDYRVTDWLQVRSGGFYETSGVDPQYQSVTLVEGDKFGFGAGATATVAKRVALDVGLLQHIIPERTFTDSKLTARDLYTDVDNPENSGVRDGHVIGNATLAANTTFIGIGATVYLGRSHESN
jgi:long-chain fatty acid transport protein